MDRLPALRARLAELARMRADYEAHGKAHFLAYVDRLIADAEREIRDIERSAPGA